MSTRDLNEIMDSGWAKALEPVAPQIAQMGDFLRHEVAAGHTYLPAGAQLLVSVGQRAVAGETVIAELS